MATKKVQTPQTTQVIAPPAAPVAVAPTAVPVVPHGPQLTVEIPTSITLKDVIVIATALITIVSSWTFYTMRLSVLEQKIIDVKAQIDKANADLDATKKDLQDLKMREQAVEIRLQYKK